MRCCRVVATLLLLRNVLAAMAFSSRVTPTSNIHRSAIGSATRPASEKHATGSPLFEPGQVLLPSASSDPIQFDTACVVNPVVVPPSSSYDQWQLYYYGNAGSWKDGKQGFLPTGWVGLAESNDGIHWSKVICPCEKGSILAPSDDPDDWDSLHIGVGDVIRISDDELYMYYLGGSHEVVEGIMPGMSLAGFRMRIGRARSLDQGRTWEKEGIVLDLDDSEGLFASWPRIVRPNDDKNNNSDGGGDDEPWQMIYHTYDGSRWKVYGATSTDQGKTWKRKGLLLEGGSSNDSFDMQGIGTRALAPWKNGMLMIYEGVDSKQKHNFGAAFCSDPNGAGSWTKIKDIDGFQQEGGPVAQPGRKPMGPWTTLIIGTPYLVNMPDGSLRLYHCGKESMEKGHAIGLMISDTGEISPDAWKPAMVGADHE
jgi:hypothetical protein